MEEELKEQLKTEFTKKAEAYLYEHLYFDAHAIVNGYCNNAEVINRFVKNMEEKL
jgi:hypothetical protein